MRNSDRTERKPKSHILIFFTILLLLAGAALLVLARVMPGFAEYYTENIYPILENTIGRVCGLVSFSISACLLLLIPILLILDLLINIRHFGTFLKHLVFLFSLILFLYAANCGVNYYAKPFVDPAETAAFTKSAEAQGYELLADYCGFVVMKLQESSEANGSGSFVYPDDEDLAEEAVKAMNKLGDEYPRLSGYYPIPKRIIVSRPFSMAGVTGIYSPFTIEANYNGEMTAFNKPFTTCHELSHLRGLMDESEANYIGWLACIGSGDPAFERSGWLTAWIYAGNDLYKANPVIFASLRSRLPDDVLAELKENNEFWETHENKASEIHDDLNDAYLKSNGQEAGIETYGKVTDLMLMWYAENRP